MENAIKEIGENIGSKMGQTGKKNIFKNKYKTCSQKNIKPKK